MKALMPAGYLRAHLARICVTAALASMVLSARAETTYYVTGGDLTEWLFWNLSTNVDFPAGKPAVTFDNGEPANRGGVVNVNDYSYQVGSQLPESFLPRPWLAAGAPPFSTDPPQLNPMPPQFDTSYSGTIVVDDAGNVVGGTFSATGTMAYHIDIFGNSVLMPELTDMTWNLATGAATGTTDCHLGDLGATLSPVFCNAAAITEYYLVAGQEGTAGAARLPVTFDPVTGTLEFFCEGFDNQQSPDSFNIDNAITFLVTTTLVSPLAADLAAVQVVSADPVAPGEPLAYTIEVVNNGPAAATGVVVTDDLPAGTVFSSASAGCTEAGGVVTCSIGNLAVGGSTTREVAVLAPAAEGAISNTASVTADNEDPNPANNASILASEVRAIADDRADIAVSQSVSSDPAIPGGPLVYTIDVVNKGPAAATGVVVTDSLPVGAAFSSASAGCTEAGGVVTCTIGNLAASESITREVVVIAPSAELVLSNTVTTTADQADPNTADNSAVLAVAVSASSGFSVQVGGGSALGGLELLLVGIVGIFRNRSRPGRRPTRMLRITVAALGAGLLGPSSSWATEFSWYAGVGGGPAKADLNAGEVAEKLTNAGLVVSDVVVDESDTGWKIFQGGTYGQHLGAELAYVDLGSRGATVNAQGSNLEELLDVSTEVLPTEVSGVSLAAVGRMPIGGRFALFIKAGALYWNSETTASLSGESGRSVAVDDDGVDVTWGLGAEVYLVELSGAHLGLRGEWERYEAGGTDLDLASANLILRFAGWNLGLNIE